MTGSAGRAQEHSAAVSPTSRTASHCVLARAQAGASSYAGAATTPPRAWRPPAAGVRKVEARVLGARACDARDVGTNVRYAVLAPSKLGEQVLGRGLGPVPRHSPTDLAVPLVQC